jgi:hypothetical protein
LVVLGAFVIGELLRYFEPTAVLHVGRDAGGVANPAPE